MCSRALPIKVPRNLDTDFFINALKFFIARAGMPEEIKSDNKTKFRAEKRNLD